MHRSKRKRNLIIFSLVGVLLCMVAGYAAFQTQLKVTGSSTVTSNWDIEITNVTAGTPTGSAENAVAPSFDKLWASMEANLYDKGDAMEYDITIENKGTLDAKLNDIITNLDKENNEAVIITFSGYTKGEVLKAKTSKVVHVKIEYNPEYEGGETSSEVEINFDYGQNNNETNNPDSQYLLTYDYSTNGGTSVELTEELIASGSNVDLSNTATKEGWNFVGWNTDKDAQIGLENYQMPASNTTLYAIYSKTLKVTYEKGENIDSIGKNEDSCNIYNNGTSCEVTLPEIIVNDDTATVGWYNGEDKIGNPSDKYNVTNNITLMAQIKDEPILKSWSNLTHETPDPSDSTKYNHTEFHDTNYESRITSIDILNTNTVPSDAITSWDVSEKQNGLVMAWIINDSANSGMYKLYIGGAGKVITNEDSSYLFANLTNLQSINLTNLDTPGTKYMAYMFYNCNKLNNLDVSNFNTTNVISMQSMFDMLRSITNLDLKNFNTSKVTNMAWMFSSTDNLTNLNISSFNTSNVKTMRGMFTNAESLINLDLSSFNTSKVNNMYAMFNTCTALQNIKGLETFDTGNVTDMGLMFAGCRNLTSLDLSNFNTSKVTNMLSMFNMYDVTFDSASTSKLTTIDVSNWDTGNVESMAWMFAYNQNLTKIKGLKSFDTSNVTNMNDMFDYCTSINDLDVSNFDTSNVTSMRYMFSNCFSLENLDVSGWNTQNVTNMLGLFNSCRSLKSINVSNWDTSNVETMNAMFSSCFSITTLNLCSFDTSKVTDMSHMFSYNSNLNTIFVSSKWNTSNVTNNENMFLYSKISQVTKSNNCAYEAENVTLDINTAYTTNSITVVADAYADSGIAKYEYSKDGGKTWEESTNSIYTFTDLTVNTSYDITVRITTQTGKTTSVTKTTITSSIATPTFNETSEGKVTITYPSGCGTTYTCTYQKEGESTTNVTNTTAEVLFGTDGTVVAQVTDGNNTVSSTYTLVRKNMYVSSSGNDTSGYGTRENPYLTLQKAYDSATSTTKANIYVMSDLDISNSIKFKDNNKNVTLTSDNVDDKTYTLRKITAWNDTVISVDAGKASFSNIIFDGNNIEDTASGVFANTGTEMTLNDGVIIQNFYNTHTRGGAGIRAQGAQVTINGAKIINNKGKYDAGIKMHDGGTLNFIDGEVSNNESIEGGGAGILLYGIDMTMTGGKVSNNKSKGTAGGLYVGYYEDGDGSTARILGGEISNNTAEGVGGGIFVNSTETQISKLEISGKAKISGNKGTYGGGIRTVNSIVEITGGTITQNTAEGGAGISINGGTLNMSDGTISNNTTTTEDGGGIRGYVAATINITGGTISENKARYGGGILIGDDNSKLTISSGTVSNNESTQGNVFIINNATFTLNGGTIKNNTSTDKDGGISIFNTVDYIYQSGVVCGNKPTNSYETSATCPAT